MSHKEPQQPIYLSTVPPLATPSATSTISTRSGPIIRCPETEEDVRNALLDWGSPTSCFDKRPAKRMHFSSIIPIHAHRYTLEAFIETRTIKTKSCTHSGLPLPPAKRPPEKWSVAVAPQAFDAYPGIYEVEFPDTSSFVPCPSCQAGGYVRCPLCGGMRQIECYECYGRGFRGGGNHYHRCWSCNGSGRIPCTACGQTGMIVCHQCKGDRYLKSWQYLEVVWSKEVKSQTTARGELVGAQLNEANNSGEVLKIQTTEKHKAIQFPPDNEVTEIAAKLVKEMLDPRRECKFLGLRQSVTIIPVVQVHYKYRDVSSRFYIYGADKRIYFPEKYPECCWGGICSDCCCDGPCAIM